jgi:Raf kinase inhibitor-like YbhB/YbcL family protein
MGHLPGYCWRNEREVGVFHSRLGWKFIYNRRGIKEVTMHRQIFILLLAACLVLLLAGCAPLPDAAEPPQPAADEALEITPTPDLPAAVEAEQGAVVGEGEYPLEMSLTSPAFNDEEAIPVEYTCDGEDISPDLDWFGIPEGTASLALIMDDPDAPVGTWVHWVLYNIPADAPGLRRGVHGLGVDGVNSWGRTGYGGPCPPGGTHRYFFKLYALDSMLDLDAGADKAAVLGVIEGHVLGQAELMGTYSR